MSAPHRTFDAARVIWLSIGHGTHDMYLAFLAPLLPLLQAKLGLSNTLAGSLATFLRSSSLARPFIGYLADRTSARLFVILAPGITAVCMSLIGVAPRYAVAALLLALVGLSHASYHAPAPAMISHFFALTFGPPALIFPLLIATGLVVFSTTPVALATLQEWLPEARSLAGGLYFSLNYIATGLAALFFGMLADRIGVQPAFNLLGLVPLATIPFALVMRDPPRPAPVDAH